MKKASKIIGTVNSWTESAMLKGLKRRLEKTSFGGGRGTYSCKAKITIIVEKLPEPKKEDRIYYEDAVAEYRKQHKY